MAQMEQKNSGRNTNITVPKKARNWSWTLNNYEVDEMAQLTQAFEEKNCKYIFQEEKGANGTPHLQGTVCFKNAVSFNTIKRMLPRAHIEKTKNLIASINYCKKSESRIGEMYTNMNIQPEEKKESREEWGRRMIKEHLEELRNDGGNGSELGDHYMNHMAEIGALEVEEHNKSLGLSHT